MRIPLKLVSAPLGALAFASMVATAPAAESRGGAMPSDSGTILGPAMLRPGTADLACGTGPAGLGPWGVDRIEQSLSLTAVQLAKFNDLKAASQKARQYLQESCPTSDPVTPTGRLTTMEQRLEAMLEAVRTVKPALDEFYGTLSDEQKARLNALEPLTVANRGDRAEAIDRAEATDRAEPAERGHRSHARRHWGFRLPIPIPLPF